MKTKKIIRKLKNIGSPLTIIFMENMRDENTLPNYVKLIKYDNGYKYISNDFYKHISLYKSRQ